MATANLGDARPRREEATTQEARAGGRASQVDLREEATVVFPVEPAHELEVRLRRLVEDERVVELVGREAPDGERLAGLGRAGVRDRARGGAAGNLRVRGAQRFARAEERVQGADRVGRGDGVQRLVADRELRARPEDRRANVLRRTLTMGHTEEELARVEPHDLADRGRQVARLAGRQLARREVERGDPEERPFGVDGDDEVVPPGRDPRVVERDAGRHHPHDLARDETLHRRRVRHLFADGDLEPLVEQPLHVAARRVVRHPCHRDLVVRALVARRQGEIERARRLDCVVEEQLVEIPHAKEDERVGVRRLRRQELPHHRRGRSPVGRPGHARQ